MKKKFFLKNLGMFLLPVFIPVLVLGTLSIFISQFYVKDEINKNNTNLLKQTRENIELILNEVDSLSLNFTTNPKIVDTLREILRKPYLVGDDHISLAEIKSFVDAPANARPYIHSIYVYFNNDRKRFITSTLGITDIDHFYDKSWYESYIGQEENTEIWIVPRTIQQYSFEKPQKILTIYRKLYPVGLKKVGAIVMNIRVDYIENQLRSLEMSPGQKVEIIGDNGITYFQFDANESEESENNSEQTGGSLLSAAYESNRESYITCELNSLRYNWKYSSIVPKRVLYKVPIKLIELTLLLLLASLGAAVFLSYFLTKQNYRRIENIISIIESAEKGKSLPPLPSRVKDEYGYIIQNILKTFIEQSYLKIQLSERKYKLETMELIALQSQMNPHFLFNTLDTINWEMIALLGKPSLVNKMLENLSDILKYSLGDPNETVTLEEEIKNTKSYINIQKFRYGDKFTVLWDYSEDITCCKVKKLLLQPLVENSIYHGIKEKEGTSSIKIRICRDDTKIGIAIIDNGLGIPRQRLSEIRQKLEKEDDYSQNIGLYNTNKRLKLSYGNEGSFQIRSRENMGTAIYITIPLLL